MVEALAKGLGDEVVAELDKSFDETHRLERRRALADHFWCDLLAAFAHLIAQVKQAVGSVPELAVETILDSRRADQRSVVGDLQVRLAVHAAWTIIEALPVFAQVDQLLRVVRVLAVLICPAPENHRAVVIYCLDPLTGQLVTAETKDRLERVLPGGWM